MICADTLSFLATAEAKGFNIVFIDPPFHQNLLSETLLLLNNHGWLAEEALIYIETEKTNTDRAGNWQLLKEKFTQQVAYRLYQKQG